MKTLTSFPTSFISLLAFIITITFAAPSSAGWLHNHPSGLVQAATPWTRTIKLFALDGTAYSSFGSGIALSGDTMVVGAPDQGNKSVAYVFIKSSGGWIQAAKLTAKDSATYDQFGKVVAISGDTIVVGAAQDGTDPVKSPGKAYVFVKPTGGWSGTLNETVRLAPSHGVTGDKFGTAVAIASAGDTIMVGASEDRRPTDPSGPGAVYIFFRPTSGWNSASPLLENYKLTLASGGSGEGFGAALAMSGSTLAVTAYGRYTFQGAAYVFEKPTGGWKATTPPAAELTAEYGLPYARLGVAVAIDNDTVVVGAPFMNWRGLDQEGEVYIFQKPGAGWSGSLHESATLVDSLGPGEVAYADFGMAVGVSGDKVVIGAPQATVGSASAPQGAVFIATRPAAGWTNTDLTYAIWLNVSDINATGGIGKAVAANSTTLIVGVSEAKVGANAGQGAVYGFTQGQGNSSRIFLPMVRK